MSTFSCPVVKVLSVDNHPNADRLSIVKLDGLGYTCISGKLEDGSPRYSPGDLVVYIPSAAILPEWLLKSMEFWNEELGKGSLSGPDGNRVKPLKLRNIFSEGVLFPVSGNDETTTAIFLVADGAMWFVELGQDVSGILGITKWEPPIPTAMAGEVANMLGHTVRYDFERWESATDMFQPGELVIASEKIHGTFLAIVYEPGLNHPEMFGNKGEIVVHSKGLGGQGLAFKNNDANASNVYVRTLKELLARDLEKRLQEMSTRIPGKQYAILGEIFGKGVQDLHYGTDKPEYRMFDLLIDGVPQPRDSTGFGHELHDIMEPVPFLYEGPFDLGMLQAVRDGKTVLGGSNVREGIVVQTMHHSEHPTYGRKICKMISPDYLTRKVKNGEATEFN